MCVCVSVCVCVCEFSICLCSHSSCSVSIQCKRVSYYLPQCGVQELMSFEAFLLNLFNQIVVSKELLNGTETPARVRWGDGGGGDPVEFGYLEAYHCHLQVESAMK